MTSWEEPASGSVRRRAVVGVVVVALLMAGAVAVSWRAGPADRLTVADKATQPAPTSTPWPRPQPGLWRQMPAAPLTPRIGHTMVWTGDEVVVWGGFDALGRALLDGAAFDPAAGAWRRLPDNDATSSLARAVWTGVDVVVVSPTETNRYDPERRTWQSAPPLPAPDAHILSDQVVTAGRSVVAVTEPFAMDERAAVFALDPDARRWRRLPDPPLVLDAGDVVLASGSRVLIYGSDRGRAVGLSLDIDGDDARWTRVDPPPDIAGRMLRRLTGVVVGERVVVWGSGTAGEGNYLATWVGERWSRLDPGPVPSSRAFDALWLGEALIVWDRLSNAGAMLNIVTDRWTRFAAPASMRDVPRPAVWTGSSLLTWGGLRAGGLMYTPR